jgi:c(7)-type cytochrome triheme protein
MVVINDGNKMMRHVRHPVVVIIAVIFLFSGCNNTAIDEKYLAALQVNPVEEKPENVEMSATNTTMVEESSSEIIQGKKLSIVNIKPIETLHQDGVHDIENDALIVLQDPLIAMADFPIDRRKQINWVATLDAGLIAPRADLKGEGEMLVMDMDILMTNTQFMPYVKFPHEAHTRWLDCSNCHPAIFIPREHANPISMNKVLRGEYCGVCHDKVAFALFTCERCHSVPHEGSGEKWW